MVNVFKYIVCGAIGDCGGQQPTVIDTLQDPTKYDVRCCSDTQPLIATNGFWRPSGDIWVMSVHFRWIGLRRYPVCPDPKSYSGAEGYCSNYGGRLCTKDELVAGLTAGTGCDHDFSMIWSSTTGPEPTPTSSPTESPTENPTTAPTTEPTPFPTENPTMSPTPSPNKGPDRRADSLPYGKPDNGSHSVSHFSPHLLPYGNPDKGSHRGADSLPYGKPDRKPDKGTHIRLSQLHCVWWSETE